MHRGCKCLTDVISSTLNTDEDFGSVLLAPEDLGSPDFRKRYGVRLAYAIGSMYRGISSSRMVLESARAGILAVFGAGGLGAEEVRRSVEELAGRVGSATFGVNLLDSSNRELEWLTCVALSESHVPVIEASGYALPTLGLALVRCKTAARNAKIIAKVSHVSVAKWFMEPPSREFLSELLMRRLITETDVRLVENTPYADDICVEGDSGGHTSQGNPLALFPRIKELAAKSKFASDCSVGLAGGIGTPASIAAAFVLGSDFVVTGSINQCTEEAGVPERIKDLLQTLDVNDTTYVPSARNPFAEGGKIQVVRKGTRFPGRAVRLISTLRTALERNCLTEEALTAIDREYCQDLSRVPRLMLPGQHLALHDDALNSSGHEQRPEDLVRRFYKLTSNAALLGERENAQIHSSAALGAFNAWYRGTDLEHWANRSVVKVANRLMCDAAALLAGTRAGKPMS